MSNYKIGLKRNRFLLLIVIVLFTFIFLTNSNYFRDVGEETSNIKSDLNHDIPKTSNDYRILINGNQGWATFKAAGDCTGFGNSTHPYVIKDLIIDARNSSSCIRNIPISF